MDTPQTVLLSMEAVGTSGLSTPARLNDSPALNYAVDAMYFAYLVYRPWDGANTVTQSTEPPYTCSVCTVVWEEGLREMSPYPDYLP